ncbi:MAG: hypothetical protein M3Z43_06035, partial [Bifidobacterium sp.]|nr:hypothetical protein [Bifidobacterium sp.]
VHPLYDVTISPKLVDIPQVVPVVRSGGHGKLAATGVSMVAPGILLIILAMMGLYLAVVARSWNRDER